MIKLVGLAQTKAFIGVPNGEDQWDALLDENLIPGVSGRIQTYLGRELEDTETNKVEQFDSDGGTRFVMLERYPINQNLTTEGIAVIVEEDVTRQFPAQTVLSTDEYVVKEDEGLIYKDALFHAFFAGSQSIRVTYRGGFKKEGGILCVPEDMKLAALMQMSYLWQRRHSLGANATDVGAGAVVWNKELALLKEVRDSLDAFKRIR